jgi:tetratricopeptide (TPR) repeat protein
VVNSNYRDIALYYYVDDLPGATIPGARLQNILDCLGCGKPLTRHSLTFLHQQGLESLSQLATGALPYDSFRELAIAERAVRVEAAMEATTAARLAQEAEKRARNAAIQEKMRLADARDKAARLARESDPKYIAKIKSRELREKFDIDTFVEQHCVGPLMRILKTVDVGQRLGQDDFVWLSTVGEEYFSDVLRAAYHRLEAEFFASEYRKTCDLWMAVNASSHYRKCGQARDADALLSTINVENQKSPKLKSAICTTRGGVMRDLSQWEEGLRLGEKAHAFKPDDYRPCTLLGAIYMETGNFNLGSEWYNKAVERGATTDSVDQDLRNIFFRADQVKQAAMREFLLHENPVRYSWVTQRVHVRKAKP